MVGPDNPAGANLDNNLLIRVVPLASLHSVSVAPAYQALKADTNELQPQEPMRKSISPQMRVTNIEPHSELTCQHRRLTFAVVCAHSLHHKLPSSFINPHASEIAILTITRRGGDGRGRRGRVKH
jgi:hypothetical protein